MPYLRCTWLAASSPSGGMSGSSSKGCHCTRKSSRPAKCVITVRNRNQPMMHQGHITSETISRSEEHTSELQSLMRISYAVFCLKKKNNIQTKQQAQHTTLTQQNT